jgi:hypothetical protein
LGAKLALPVPRNLDLDFPNSFKGKIPMVAAIAMVRRLSFPFIPLSSQKMRQLQTHKLRKVFSNLFLDIKPDHLEKFLSLLNLLEKIHDFRYRNLDVHRRFSFRFDLGGSKPVYRRSAYFFKPLFPISHKKVYTTNRVTSAVPAEWAVDIAGKEATEGVYFFNRYVANSPPKGKEAENEKLTEWFKKKSGKTADMGVAFGYDSVLIMADAIKRARQPNPAKIREALEKTDYFGLTGRVKFDASHHSQPRVSISQVRNGVPQIIYQLKD